MTNVSDPAVAKQSFNYPRANSCCPVEDILGFIPRPPPAFFNCNIASTGEAWVQGSLLRIGELTMETREKR